MTECSKRLKEVLETLRGVDDSNNLNVLADVAEFFSNELFESEDWFTKIDLEAVFYLEGILAEIVKIKYDLYATDENSVTLVVDMLEEVLGNRYDIIKGYIANADSGLADHLESVIAISISSDNYKLLEDINASVLDGSALQLYGEHGLLSMASVLMQYTSGHYCVDANRFINLLNDILFNIINEYDYSAEKLNEFISGRIDNDYISISVMLEQLKREVRLIYENVKDNDALFNITRYSDVVIYYNRDKYRVECVELRNYDLKNISYTNTIVLDMVKYMNVSAKETKDVLLPFITKLVYGRLYVKK